ncbi:MAG: hypothetical protein IKV44_06445 [Clostridia bacterium]|nr:hypothetical protein [Clostridia bacterium]
MSTSAAIGIKLPDGSVKAIRLNWDGYVAHAGTMLGGWYKTAEAADRWPFMVEGILLGLFSAVLGLGIEYGVYSVASIWLSDVMAMLGGDVVSFNEYIWYIFGIFVFIGVFIGAFGSILSLNKYLKEHSNVVENQ